MSVEVVLENCLLALHQDVGLRRWQIPYLLLRTQLNKTNEQYFCIQPDVGLLKAPWKWLFKKAILGVDVSFLKWNYGEALKTEDNYVTCTKLN